MKKNYSTRDLYEAAYLYASGLRFLHIEGHSKTKYFIFEDEDTVQKYANSYYRKEGLINAKEYAEAINTLKGLLFNKRS